MWLLLCPIVSMWFIFRTETLPKIAVHFVITNKFDIASNALKVKTQYFFYYFSPMKMRYVFFTLVLTENYLLQSISAARG